ncbi:MAG: SDR family NAD(P)-dependent oxidoreductase [Candidatus Riflebacteria bacterium]|nr:SDR family NAD(P)-dependent oxidoreductase [Candidatus Riflebacteria bacterium]
MNKKTKNNRDPLQQFNNNEPIAILGIGCRFPGGINGPDDLWKFLCQGKDAIADVPKNRWSKRLFFHPDKNRPGKIYSPKGGFLNDLEKFDPEFFGLSPREAALMDPQQRLLLETTWEALEDGGINPKNLAGTPTGVFIGLFMHDYENIHSQPSERRLKGPHSATGMSTTLAANRISYLFDFRGPSFVVDTACSSSLITIHLACQSLRNNESKIAIAGGVNVVLNPEVTMSLCKASMLSSDGYCKAFDSRANGYTRSEGTGLVVLKTLSRALYDKDPIYAIIKASVTNQDGKSEGQTVPSQKAQEAAIEETLKRAGIRADEIQYVEAHGTGTPVGDPIEANAIGSVLSKNRDAGNECFIGSIKTNIGHTESAAGVAGVIKLALMLKHKQIPPHLHFVTPNPKISFETLRLKVPTSLIPWRVGPSKTRLGGVNSFGFGGSNAHAILEEFKPEMCCEKKPQNESEGRNLILPLSGHNKEALQAMAHSCLDFLESEEVNLTDLGYTLSCRKGVHQHRLTIAAKTVTELKERLKAYIEQEKNKGAGHRGAYSLRSLTDGALAKYVATGAVKSGPRKMAFVFSGMGQQWWAMGRQLLQNEPIFKKMIEKCDALFKKHNQDWSLIEELTRNEESSRIDQTQIAQSCIFAVQVALYELWRSYGILPDFILGHSVGEVSGAYAAGILSLEDAVMVSYNRSRLQAKTAGQGKMLAIGLSLEKMAAILKLYEDNVSVAAINSPSSITLSGDTQSLEEIASVLESENFFSRFLKVEVPYHSPFMNTILSELKTSLSTLSPKEGNIPYLSTVTGNLISGKELNGDYWCKNAREPVMFFAGINELVQMGASVFVEIGAHPVLAGSIKECLAHRSFLGIVLPSLRRKEDENLLMLNSLGQLYCSGFSINWNIFYTGEETFLRLPRYPWQRESYWTESEESLQSRTGMSMDEEKIHPLIGELQVESVIPTWYNEIDLFHLPYLNGHQVQGSILYPGAAFIEMGIAVAKERFGDVPCALENVEIKAPLLLHEDSSPYVKILFESGENFSIHSKAVDSQKWTCHATGHAEILDNISLLKKDISEIKMRLTKEEEKSESYRRFHSLGLEYGREFQSIEHLWMSENEVLGKISCGKEVSPRLNEYWLHPVILDACFQVLASIPINGTYLPVKIESIKFFKRPQSCVYGYAKVVEKTSNRVKGDIQIIDEEGNLVSEIQGLHCQYVEGTRKMQLETIDGALYQYEWLLCSQGQKQSADVSSSFLPFPENIYDNIKKEISDRVEQYDRKKFYKVVEPKLNKLCRDYFVTALKKLNYSFQTGKVITGEDFVNKLGIVQGHTRLFNRILEILEQEGVFQKTPEGWKCVSQPKETCPSSMWKKMLFDHPDYSAELLLIERCGSNLAEILQGKADPLSLIFPSESLVAEQLYHISPTLRMYNWLAQRIVSEILNSLPEGQTLRILEIGAGTGSLASWLLPVLPPHRVKYVFTDVSLAFTTHAEEKFKKFPFVNFKTLNIEKDLQSQGFDPHSFDLIFASDVVHATCDLSKSLKNLNSLLSSKGMVVLVEVTRLTRWLDLVFGTLSGWWLFSDTDIRPNHALLSREEWLRVLKNNGFSQVVAFFDSVEKEPPLHCTLVAQRQEISRQDKTFPKTDEKTYFETAAKQAMRPHIVLSDKQGVAEKISGHFRKLQIVPFIVSKGNNFEEINPHQFIVRPDSDEDIGRVMSRICNDASHSPVIINLWALSNQKMETLGVDELKRITNETCVSILHLLHSLKKENWSQSPELWFITSGTQTVGGLKDLTLEQTPVWGLGRVIVTEHPEFKTRMVDISPQTSDEEISFLFEEIFGNSSEDEIALRGDKRFVHRLVKWKESNFTSLPDKPFSLYKTPSKSMEGFVFEEVERKAPDIGEVEIKVNSVGLNFKDLAKILGIVEPELSKNDFISKLGLECSGVVVKTGRDVSSFKVGDEVMGFVPNCFSNYALANSRLIVHKPSYLSFEEAATIPLAFLTVYYSLHHLAKIRGGDKILIHTGTGGIGLAAIQAAQAAGAEIFATAGNPEKRQFLKSIGISYVGDSRSLNFHEEILSLTEGKGVDIVLNTLTGKGLFRSIELLKKGTGRFIDLSNIYSEAGLKLNSFKEGMSFFAFDLERIAATNPEILETVWQNLLKDIFEKKINALPHRVFPIAEVESAFKSMKQTRHLGKIVVSFQETGVSPVSTRQKISIGANGTYLLTGGLGGFGLAIAKWLVECGAKNLVLVGRSGDDKPEAAKAVRDLRSMGAEVFVGRVDVSHEDQVKTLFTKLEKCMPPVRGIIHAAMVLEDVYLKKMTAEQMKKVMDPKILGAWNLHTQTLTKNLDFFILFSSFTSLIGNEGQGNYSAGNSFLDSLSHYRQAHGLPSLTLCWGPIGEVGYVAQRDEIMDFFSRQGVLPLSLTQSKRALVNGLEKRLIQVGAISINWKRFHQYSASVSQSPRFSELITREDENSVEDRMSHCQTKLAVPDSSEERQKFLKDVLSEIVGKVLKISLEKIDIERALEEYGLDSLMAVELNAKVKSALGVELPKMIFLQAGFSVEQLIKVVEKVLLKDNLEARLHLSDNSSKMSDIDEKKLPATESKIMNTSNTRIQQ